MFFDFYAVSFFEILDPGDALIIYFYSPGLSYRGSVLIRAAIWGLKRSIARGLFPISFSRFLFGDPGMNLSGRNLSGEIALSNTFNQEFSTGEVYQTGLFSDSLASYYNCVLYFASRLCSRICKKDLLE